MTSEHDTIEQPSDTASVSTITNRRQPFPQGFLDRCRQGLGSQELGGPVRQVPIDVDRRLRHGSKPIDRSSVELSHCAKVHESYQ